MRFRKLLARTALGLGALLALLVGAVFYQSSAKLGHRYHPVVQPVFVRPDPESIARGAELARMLGCIGCHGDGLGGKIFISSPIFGRLVAPNLTRVRDRYSDLDFVRLLRHGIRPAGTPVLPAMPAQAFSHLADDDVGAIIAYLRSLPALADSLPSTHLALPMRAMLALGVIEVVPESIDGARPALAAAPREDPIALGQYLALAACSECHGPDLGGNDRFLISPGLAIVAGYSREQFRSFLRTGIALGGRELPTMSRAARARFAGLRAAELDALHAYLTTLDGGAGSSLAAEGPSDR